MVHRHHRPLRQNIRRRRTQTIQSDPVPGNAHGFQLIQEVIPDRWWPELRPKSSTLVKKPPENALISGIRTNGGLVRIGRDPGPDRRGRNPAIRDGLIWDLRYIEKTLSQRLSKRHWYKTQRQLENSNLGQSRKSLLSFVFMNGFGFGSLNRCPVFEVPFGWMTWWWLMRIN